MSPCSHSSQGGSSTSLFPWAPYSQEGFRKHLGTGALPPQDRPLPSVPSLHAWGTTSLPSLPLLKCRNSDKPVIFLQSAKSQWTSQKPAVKDTSSWPSYLCLHCPWLSLEGIYSCRSGGIPARAASRPCCPCPSQWVCWLCLSQHPCPPGSCPRAASQPGNKSDSQPHPCSLLNRDAGKAGQQPRSHSSCAGCDPTVPTASPAPGP